MGDIVRLITIACLFPAALLLLQREHALGSAEDQPRAKKSPLMVLTGSDSCVKQDKRVSARA